MVGAIASVQFGSALAVKLFSQVGPDGVVLLRLSSATVVLLIVWRPRLQGRTRRELLLAGVFGMTLAGMNLSFYSAIHRIPLGIAVDASGNLKPWTDQTYNVGSFNNSGSGSGLRPETVYVAGNASSGSGFELGKFASESYELCNDSSTGTIVNGLAMLSTAGCAIKPASALTSGAIGVVIANAGTSGIATLAKAGSVFCSFDGTSTVIGDYVVPSSTSGSFYLCHDDGAARTDVAWPPTARTP